MSRRNTKQKEIILQSIINNKTHLTMAEILNKVWEIDSNVGQATIYRNVNKLVEEGLITKLVFKDGVHYDGTTTKHNHFMCLKCGKIYDLVDNNYAKNTKTIEKMYPFIGELSSTIYEGECINCQTEKR